MNAPPANSFPSSAPPPAGSPRRSFWKPLLITLLFSGILGLITCAGGLSIGNGTGSLGGFLLYAGLMFLGVFCATALAIVVYFFIWLIQKLR